MESPAQDPDVVNALDAPVGDVAGGSSGTQTDQGDSLDSAASPNPDKQDNPDKKPVKEKKSAGGNVLQRVATHVNIYLLIFILIIIVAALGVFVSIQQSKKEAKEASLTTQDLSQEALEQINENEVKVGDPKQTLSIESNAKFAGNVLVQKDLDVAGTIKVGNSLNLPGLTVSGTSTFDLLQANKLSIDGDGSIQGTLTIQDSLTVAGGGSFGGPLSAPQITVQNLQLNNNLILTRHIDAGGPTPGISRGTALGGGGTATVSGTDTAGTVTINTGSGPVAGCFATISFANTFNATPHIVLTPVGSAAAGLNWYTNRSNSSFSVCTTNAAPAGQNFAFDFVAID
jgi:cytoskeletal protein CcmA (bactofilin family)